MDLRGGVTEIARNYAKLRYRLMPLLYPLFYEAHTRGCLFGEVFVCNTAKKKRCGQAYDSQFMLGDDYLSALYRVIKVSLSLSTSDWFDFYSDKHYTGEQAHC